MEDRVFTDQPGQVNDDAAEKKGRRRPLRRAVISKENFLRSRPVLPETLTTPPTNRSTSRIISASMGTPIDQNQRLIMEAQKPIENPSAIETIFIESKSSPISGAAKGLALTLSIQKNHPINFAIILKELTNTSTTSINHIKIWMRIAIENDADKIIECLDGLIKLNFLDQHKTLTISYTLKENLIKEVYPLELANNLSKFAAAEALNRLGYSNGKDKETSELLLRPIPTLVLDNEDHATDNNKKETNKNQEPKTKCCIIL